MGESINSTQSSTLCGKYRYRILYQWHSPNSMQFFFFSGRRRHTRCSRDWSSDVCFFRSVSGGAGALHAGGRRGRGGGDGACAGGARVGERERAGVGGRAGRARRGRRGGTEEADARRGARDRKSVV